MYGFYGGLIPHLLSSVQKYRTRLYTRMDFRIGRIDMSELPSLETMKEDASDAVASIESTLAAELTSLEHAALPTVTSLEEVILGTPLTPLQEKAVSHVYQDAKHAAELIFREATTSKSVKLTQLMAKLMKLVQTIRIDDAPLKGADKRTVVTELMKRLLKDILGDSPSLSSMLSTAESIGEHLLDTLVDLGKSLSLPVEEQQVLEEVEQGCCALFQAICSKK